MPHGKCLIVSSSNYYSYKGETEYLEISKNISLGLNEKRAELCLHIVSKRHHNLVWLTAGSIWQDTNTQLK